jgi:predicted adenylyl cyclase CyaB
MRNLEIKATLDDPRRARRVLGSLGARRIGPDLRQTDWYFNVPAGRLKLRRPGAGCGAELIAYARPDTRGARVSDFVQLPVADRAAALRLLGAMLGVRACVRKRRELWLLDNARIHLDRVAGLGTFLEIEVVVSTGMRQARGLMRRLRRELGAGRATLIGASYVDMLTPPAARAARSRARPGTARPR